MKAAVVIAVAHPVELAGVEGVAPAVFEQPVLIAVGGVLGMAMEFTAKQAQLLAAHGGPIVAHAGNILRLVLVDDLRLGRLGRHSIDELWELISYKAAA